MKQIFSLVIIAFILSGCVSAKPKPKQEDLQNLQDVHYKLDKKGELTLQKKYALKDEAGKIVAQKTKEEPVVEKVPLFDKGYKKQLSLKGKAKKEIAIHGDRVKVSVESIPLNEFVDLVFGSVLKLNYTVDESVKKMKTPITLNMQTTQKVSQFYKVVKKILLLNGVKINDENNLLFIHKSGKSNANELSSDVYIGYGRSLPADLDADKEVLLFVPYNYIDPNNIIKIFRQIGISGNDVKFYYYINGIQTMKGKAFVIRKALKLIDLLDRPYLKGKTPYLINFQDIEVEKFVSQMQKIFALNGINVVDSPSKGGIVMMPIKDLNMLYIITPKKEWLKMLLYWKKKLDVPTDVKEEPRLYIYHVKNRKADELASALKEVLGLSKQTTKTTIKKKSDIAKQKTEVKQGKGQSSFLLQSTGYTPTVTADLDTNMLMLKLTPKHYRVLLPFIEELDKLPLQTLVEVTVADVDMTDTFSLGFEYAITNQNAGLVKNILNITGGGSGLGVVFKGNHLESTINAYAEKKLLDIISKPKLLILNNKTGNINVGTQVPIITSQVSAADLGSSSQPSINQNISYKNTGIILNITPTINSNGVLTMNISITLSDAQLNDTSTINSPLIINRSLQTTAVVQSGDSILLGGLISQNKSKSKGGVPLLKDIPWIGNMFASNSIKTTKSELIILIRPVIIKTPQEINSETYKFKKILNYINIDGL
ncbi:secretin N-terminal domain-containing protein [Sulfurimonas autotrophica]|uniref:Type II and III secretion system protein n=1 Tax=Sulfurimonas autotrophica (strain ATCC BAA-671 / DSM 16294 / JCM 11897 / OK10) TaxID=563040 RepID=E0UU16_SULAO|nr:secretin N-terminal domain-containing protein [Sulfurimonas autotrophica]ADN08325.1 type II and III secretion system protein [Sulfurimonas autotrophica DSM 16294]